ncbi:MAG TPA: alcohol dehydrogenase, partial [Rhodospirillaceae bacterium]|nr:alcohol dehydrogenase [Rhodospirillaceae bacterium]
GGAKLSVKQHQAINRYIIARNQQLSDAQLLLFDDLASAETIGDTVAWSGPEAVAAMALSRGGFENKPLLNYQSVSKGILENPKDADWLSWRRTLDGQGYSPLRQIDRRNVGKLRLAWSLAMTEGSNQGTPLVYNGIMFLTHPTNMLQAVDGATGEVLWEYSHEYPEDSRVLGGPMRNIAIYGDKLFMTTYDAAIVAIDAATGAEVWHSEKADYSQAYTHSAGPIIGDGVVLSGINGCELYTKAGCFITGHDPDTGKELWRTSTIALPGSAGGDTWAGLAAEYRAGGDMWIAGSYDADLGLFVIGTSQPKPWVAASRGMTPRDQALFTNTTLALDPHTGEIKWHFQHVPGETIDMEVGFERLIANLNGTDFVFTIGKDGILWKLDLQTGKYVDLLETLPQTVFKTVDRERGIVVYRDDIMSAPVGKTITACPGIYGGHNWQSMAFVPQSKSLVIPLHQTCSEMTGQPVEQVLGGGGFGAGTTTYPMPGHNDNLGALISVNAVSMAVNWRVQQRAMFLTGALTTGGGLTFIGDLDRFFKAFDSDTGKELWSSRLAAPLHGYPVTYAVDGKQYIAVQTGIGVFRALTATLAPEIYQPTGGQAIYVFELPAGE